MSSSDPLPLKPLHDLNQLKLYALDRLATDSLIVSLKPGQDHCLKTRADGTILDGYHGIEILRRRGVDVKALPREVLVKE